MKEIHFLSEVYLRVVRRMPCAFCGVEGESDPHHYPPTGRGITLDSNTIPVCRICHSRCHGITVVGPNGRRLPPIPVSAQEIEVNVTLRAFHKTATPEEWAQFTADRNSWYEKRRLQLAGRYIEGV